MLDYLTMLHVAVKRTDVAADIQLLLDHGADKSIRDNDGKRAFDLTRRSLKDIRALLKWVAFAVLYAVMSVAGMLIKHFGKHHGAGQDLNYAPSFSK